MSILQFPGTTRDTSWSGKGVAITGATGFVGYHLARTIRQRGGRVIALVRGSSRTTHLHQLGVPTKAVELLDTDAVAEAMADCRYVFHIAAAVDLKGDWHRFRQINVEGTRSVIKAAHDVGIERVIVTSSASTVGASRQPVVLDESSEWDLARFRMPYITTKREAEQLALSMATDRTEIVAVNPSLVVGPDDHSGSEFGRLCHRFWRSSRGYHFGGGVNVIDVRDVVDGHLNAARHGRSGERYLLAGENYTTAAFYDALNRATPLPRPYREIPKALTWSLSQLSAFTPKRLRFFLLPNQVRLLRLYYWYDSAKAAHEFGFRARPLDETLRATYGFWMRERRAAA